MGHSSATILVVDDEPDLRTLYELTLLREGYRVETAGTLAQARAHLHICRFDVLITDMRLPDGLGMELLRELREQRRPERAIVMTAYGSAENAVEALRYGAFDYLTKPVDLKQFRTIVASAVSNEAAAPIAAAPLNPPNPMRSNMGEILTASAALDRLVGTSAAIQQVKQRIQKVAQSMAPVLVTGESGTGKELVARALHACSHRAHGPWVAVNCGAIPEHLLEAEFFGARKGAYTGATADREGFFSAARGGTLFLDEIGELPLAMQSKLLRVIQERRVRPLGTTQEEAVDVRIVSATHRDLAADVQTGNFRQDLYYRLNVIDIPIPPLRERREDVPTLCTVLLQRIAGEGMGNLIPTLSPHVLAHLQQQPLHGNVRELENLLHRAIALNEEMALPAVADPAAPAALQHSPPHGDTEELPSDLQAWLDQQERSILMRALHSCGYNRTAAAARLGISLRQMRYRIARLQIPLSPEEMEPASDNALYDAYH
ncbi:sigma-54 dependent transcriptional regulator [Comamonas sp.]|uniref:sigma-54-dependent transcriptional regulator n=1 Tax=Comamonas sp. TaxID=34028 RepID=UPI0028A10172|nr:sigma-54 dependent transcriptional regulator [Comamonas sp.]